MDKTVVIRVFDRDLNFLGEVDDYTSLLYVRKWYTYGSFQITLNYKNPLLAKDNIIMLNSDTSKNGIIKYAQYDERQGVATIKGYSLLWFMAQRITPPPFGEAYQEFKSLYPIQVLWNLVHVNAIGTAEESPRNIPCLEIGGKYIEMGQSRINFQTRYNNLMNDLTTLAKAYHWGIGIDLDWRNKKMLFMARQETDRTASQSENKRCIFRDSYDTTTNQVYTVNDLESRNCAYVAGQGEGADRDWVLVGNENAGMDRRETFIDARDISNFADLPARGTEKLAGMLPAENYIFDAVVDGYEVDWDLGDKVTVISDTYDGIRIDAVVTEVEEAIDSTGRQIVPTIGDSEKTLRELIGG